MKLIKTVKDKEYEMQCSHEQAEILLKDSRYRKADDNSAAEKAAREAAEKADAEKAEAEKAAAEKAEAEKAEAEKAENQQPGDQNAKSASVSTPRFSFQGNRR